MTGNQPPRKDAATDPIETTEPVKPQTGNQPPRED